MSSAATTTQIYFPNICVRKENEYNSSRTYTGLIRPLFHEISTSIESLAQDQKYITLLNKIEVQFGKMSEIYEGKKFQDISIMISQSLSTIISLEPQVVTAQLTMDNSIFYTLKHAGESYYFEYFIDSNISIDSDEVVLTVFNKDNKVDVYSGSFNEMILNLSKIMSIS